MRAGRVYVAGTCDTKGDELAFVRALIEQSGCTAVIADLSTRPAAVSLPSVIAPRVIAACHPEGDDAVFSADRGEAIAAMGVAFERFLASRADVAGVIGLGGSGGTAIITRAMRALPIGVPKLMVSTVASANVAPYVGPSDIAMMYSVTDIAGLNRISRVVLANAAHAVAGMARAALPAVGESKPAIGLTMFGVTTPCVNRVTTVLNGDFDCLVFHATGTGGQSMEKLADSALIGGMIDVTTTEVCDLLLGGVFACSEDRFGAVARTRLPYVGSCGALDMVNFGAVETVPERYRGRNLYVHNPQVTLMRTTAEECTVIGRWIGDRLNACDGCVKFLIPEGGVSLLDAPGMAFFDRQADAALFAAIEASVVATEKRQVIRLPFAINAPEFADALVAAFRSVMAHA